MARSRTNDGIERHMTLEEIAAEMGVTREAVRKIEKRALAKVRKAFEARGLGPTELDEDHSHQGPGLFDINDRAPVLRYRRK